MGRASRHLIVAACVASLAAAPPAWAANGVPAPISPGRAEAFAPAASVCPTFSWTAVEGARGYELVVYEAPTSGESGAAGRKSAEPVLRQRIAGAGLSWTPPADGCLALAGAYAWSVRALGAGKTAWSEAALFRVEPAVPVGELAAVVERALGRYLESQGLPPAPGGRLAGLISEELAAGDAAAAPPAAPPRRVVYSGGRRHLLEAGEPIPRGVFTDEVELVLGESGSGTADKVQLVFTTPEFDGDPVNGDAWAIVVDASATALETGTMSISAPDFTDVAQFYTDGSAIIGELREMTLRPLASPPFSCTTLQEGSFYWDDSISLLCVCDGSSWEPVDGDATGSCS